MCHIARIKAIPKLVLLHVFSVVVFVLEELKKFAVVSKHTKNAKQQHFAARTCGNDPHCLSGRSSHRITNNI